MKIKKPQSAQERKTYPLGSFLAGYFPDALMYLSHLSWKANEQHNPGEPMHWAREKSTDQLDCAARHLLQAGTIDDDGLLHTGKLAWRSLAMLQLELERHFALAEQNQELGQHARCECCDGGTCDYESVLP